MEYSEYLGARRVNDSPWTGHMRTTKEDTAL